MVQDGASYLLDQALDFLTQLGEVVLVLVVYFAIAWVASKFIIGRLRDTKLINKYGKNGAMFTFRLISITIYIVATLAALSQLGVETSGILTLVSAFTVAIGLSLQDVLRNLFAGIFMLAERPFSVGDRVVVRDREGTIQGIDIRTTMIRTEDGALLMVPNQLMFTEILQNDSRYNLKSVRYNISTKLLASELEDRITNIVEGIEGVRLRHDSFQLVQYQEDGAEWQVTFSINSRKLQNDYAIAEALIANLPDCVITKV